MKNIKCFVSMRTDVKHTNVVDSPLYVPVYCGAAFEKEKDSAILGDDTGDQISDKKEYLSEFTVQYWVWKNVQIDYYGLCHYRRYLAFQVPHIIPREADGLYRIPYLNKFFSEKLGLLDVETQMREIEKYDLLVNESVAVRHMPNINGQQETVYDHWKTAGSMLLDTNYIDYMLEIIQQRRPDVYDAACQYMFGGLTRGYNCYIMRAELFNSLNEFQFCILDGLREYAEVHEISLSIKRTYGFIGEILYGIYIYYLLKQDKYRVKELPLVLIKNTAVGNESIIKSFVGIGELWIIHYLRKIWNVVLPYGTRRRMYIDRLEKTLAVIWDKYRR